MNKLMKRTAATASAFLILMTAGATAKAEPQGGPAVLAGDFYERLNSTPAIQRDFFLDEQLNKTLSGRGLVASVDDTGRYKRRYRIVLSAASTMPKITFYLFADGDDYRTLLSEGDLFEFKGRFVVYTPLNTRRDAYIFDVVMEEGAVVVDEGR